MKPLLLSLIISAFLFTACSKGDGGRICGCIPPLTPDSKQWKITKIFGGIGGMNKPLTNDQKNNVLIIYSTNSFACINSVTGASVYGNLAIANFNSIFGVMPRYNFSPALPMLTEDPLLLVDSSATKMVFGENVTDGYQITFERVQ